MKLLLLACITIITSVPLLAQRNCGTMQNLEYLKGQDPSLEERHRQTELTIQKWIKDHPDERERTNLPMIKGIVPMGNPDKDKEAYAKAKKSIYENDPVAYRKMVETNTTFYRQPVQSEKKRKYTSFQPLKSN